MATLKEQDIVLTNKDADGNPVIQMPITRLENVEGLSDEIGRASCRDRVWRQV